MAITQQDIFDAADAVEAEGGNPTMDLIRQKLGNTGSFATISPALRKWKENKKVLVRQVVEMPHEIRALMERIGSEVWKSASGLAGEQMETFRQEYDKKLTDAESERDEMIQEVARLETSLDSMESEKKEQALALETASAELIRKDEKISNRENTIQTVKNDLVLLQGEKDEQAKSIQGILNDLENYKKQLEKSEKENLSMRDELQKSASTIARGLAEKEALEKEVGRIGKDKQDAIDEGKLVAAESVKLKTTVAGLEARVDDRNISIGKFEIRVKELQQVEIEVVKLEAGNEKCNARIRELSKEIGELKEAKKLLEQEVESLKSKKTQE